MHIAQLHPKLEDRLSRHRHYRWSSESLASKGGGSCTSALKTQIRVWVCWCFPATGVWHYQQSSESFQYPCQQGKRLDKKRSIHIQTQSLCLLLLSSHRCLTLSAVFGEFSVFLPARGSRSDMKELVFAYLHFNIGLILLLLSSQGCLTLSSDEYSCQQEGRDQIYGLCTSTFCFSTNFQFGTLCTKGRDNIWEFMQRKIRLWGEVNSASFYYWKPSPQFMLNKT